MRHLGAAIAMFAALLAGCTGERSPAASGKDPAATAAPAAPTASPWEAKVGQLVTVEGVAEDAKIGAILTGPDAEIWIDALEAWPDAVRGRRVKVTGKVIERADLPVFVEEKGEAMQGMPVPPGTDLKKAARRWLLAGARWTIVE